MNEIEAELRKSLNFADGRAMMDVSLKIPQGQWLAILGPSGAGKTTVLRLLAGLCAADEGHIKVGQDVWLDTASRLVKPTRLRKIGFVFQDHALFPHMTARKNIAFALPRGADEETVTEVLELVGLAGLAERYPSQLSGGQQQRLALARALTVRPLLLLLDEPLSSLDPRLRKDMQDLLLDIRQRGLVQYAVLVTHDDAEAGRLVDRMIRMDRGSVIADEPSQPAPGFHTLALPAAGTAPNQAQSYR